MDIPPELQDQVENIDEDRTSYFIASVSVVVGIATACIALRIYARKLKKLPLAADDYTIILALVRKANSTDNVFLAKHARKLFLVLHLGLLYFKYIS